MAPSPVSRALKPGSLKGRGLSFVAIVWAIAGSFWVLFEGQTWLIDQMLRFDRIPDWVTASRVKPADCVAILARKPARPPDAATRKRARWAAWEMGLSLGMATALRDAGASDPEENRKARADYASAIGVPTPEVAPVRSPSHALSEFREHMAEDPQCVGAALAAFYSPRDDALYRFAAFVGHNMIYRARNPQFDPLFVPELRRYGRAAGLPDSVWAPLTEPRAGVLQAIAGLSAYVRSQLAAQE